MPKQTHGGRRQNAGRPKLYQDRQQMTVTLPAELLTRLEAWMANRKIATKSEAIRVLLGKLK